MACCESMPECSQSLSFSVECSKCSSQPVLNLRSPTKDQPSRNSDQKKLKSSYSIMPSWATKEQKIFWPWFVQFIMLRSKLSGVSRGKLGKPLPVNGVRDPENTSSSLAPKCGFPRIVAKCVSHIRSSRFPIRAPTAMASLEIDGRRSATRKFAQFGGALK